MAPKTSELHSLLCPKCGAPLEIETTTPSITCQYCSDVVENPYYRPPKPEAPPLQVYIPPAPRADAGLRMRAAVRPAQQTSVLTRIVQLLVFAVIVVVGGGGLLVGIGASIGAQNIAKLFPGGQIPFGLPLVSQLAPVNIRTPGLWLSNDGVPNVIAVTWDVSADKYSLSRLDVGSKKIVWSALEQSDTLQVDELLAGENVVYAVIGTRLIALQLTDGKQVWESTLPDKLPGVCYDCVVYQQGQVVALTTDYSLGAYDALTGHQTWEKHFTNAGDTLYPAGAGVAVMYGTKQGAALGVIDAATGNETTHIEPACAPQGGNGLTDQMDTFSQIVVDNLSQPARAYVFFGMFNGCIQRWNLSTGKMDWQHVESEGTPGGFILLNNGTLFYDQGSQLRSIDAATGRKVQTLDDTQNYQLMPLLVSGQRLVAVAKRTQGTTRFELWGYDLTAGKNLWKHPLPSQPIDGPYQMSGLLDKDSPGFTTLQTPAGLWLITFQATPNQVALAQVNLDTGEQSGQKTLSLPTDTNIDFYDVPARLDSQDHLAWFFAMDGIYVVDPATGAFRYRLP